MRIGINVRQIIVELMFVVGEFICRLINRRQRDRNPDDYDY